MRRPVIALDADGVLLDFHLAYAAAWQRAFGHYPEERDPLAYWPMDRWRVPRLGMFRRRRFKSEFGEYFWSSVPPLEGAVQACHQLREAGFDLVCVSALDSRFEAARLRNLRSLDFPIERVIATGNNDIERSPKADAVEDLRPEAFVDDYLPYFRGVPDSVHRALVLRAPNGSPNAGPELELIESTHQDLAAFTRSWLSR
jgi:phosphoglycolate phosphatase-like HAD superfamily hydrolase